MRRFTFSLVVIIASLGWLGSMPSKALCWSWGDGYATPTYTAYYANFYANPYYSNPYYYGGYYGNWGTIYRPYAYAAPTYPAYAYSTGYYYTPTYLGYYFAPYVYAGYYYPAYIPSYYYTPAIYSMYYPYYGYYYPYWYMSAYYPPITTSGYAATPPTTSNVQQASATTTTTTISSTSPFTTLNVEVMDNGFNPETMTIVVGTTVRWTNTGKEKHTVSSETDKWDSGEFSPGQAFSATFTQPGIYNYSCKLHKELRGTIIVK